MTAIESLISWWGELNAKNPGKLEPSGSIVMEKARRLAAEEAQKPVAPSGDEGLRDELTYILEVEPGDTDSETLIKIGEAIGNSFNRHPSPKPRESELVRELRDEISQMLVTMATDETNLDRTHALCRKTALVAAGVRIDEILSKHKEAK